MVSRSEENGQKFVKKDVFDWVIRSKVFSFFLLRIEWRSFCFSGNKQPCNKWNFIEEATGGVL